MRSSISCTSNRSSIRTMTASAIFPASFPSSTTLPISAPPRSGCCRFIHRHGSMTVSTSANVALSIPTTEPWPTCAGSSTPPMHAASVSSPSSSSITRPISTHGSSGRATPSPARPRVNFTSGRTATRNMPRRGSSLSIPSAPTGPGIPPPAPISGTASTRISRISITTIRASSRRCLASCAIGSSSASMASAWMRFPI